MGVVRLMVLAAIASGCAKTVPVQIDMSSASIGTADVVPKFLELQHEEQGWILVDIDNEQRVARRLADGEVVTVIGEGLPKGRYEAIRFVYLAATPAVFPARTNDAAQRADAAGAAVVVARPIEWVPSEALLLQRFCIGGSREDSSVTLTVRRSHPGEITPTTVSVDAPQCSDLQQVSALL